MGRRLRRFLAVVSLLAAFVTFYFTLLPPADSALPGGGSAPVYVFSEVHPLSLPPSLPPSAGLEQFLVGDTNCSLPRVSLGGEGGVVSIHQWFHAVGYSLDDLRVHWAFPRYPGVSVPQPQRESVCVVYRLRIPLVFSGGSLTRRLGRQLGGNMLTGYLAISCPHTQVQLPSSLISLSLSLFLNVSLNDAGQYVFQVSLTETTSRASLEFWLSPSPNPHNSLLLTFTSLSQKV